ncbi:MAG: E3 ubiquitin protein ligase [Candidatus Lokiarchaeota archaeon]|nr:E3 ubiquitin protein ligase [Candidatus Lokiarchaeota archaeon]
MGKKVSAGKNVRKSLVSSVKKLLQEISADYPGLEYTRAVDTYIFEKIKETPLKAAVMREGDSLMTGNLLWATDKDDGVVVLFLENKKYLYPTNDNVKGAFFYIDKKGGGRIEIEMHPNPMPCAICSKPMEIFDESSACPSCGATSHVLHLEEWIQMKGSCSVCNARLAIDSQHKIVLA